MLKEFLRYVKDNKSRNTFNTYVTVLTPFDTWLKTRKSSIEKATTNDVRDYLVLRKHWTMTSGMIFLQSLKSYVNFFLNHMPIGITPNEIRDSMMEQQRLNQIKSFMYPANLANTKKPKDKVKSMSIQDLEKFFRIADYEDKIWAYLLLYFCLRKNELFEINRPRRYMKVDFVKMKATFGVEKHKGYYPKTLDFDETTKKILEEYLKTTPPGNESLINKRFKRYDKKMGYRVYPHLLRHISISHFNRTLPPLYPNYDFLIKHIAGHIQKDMTSVYTDPKVFSSELKEIMCVNHFLKSVNIQWN